MDVVRQDHSADHASTAQCVINTLNTYEIPFGNLKVLLTDNTAYNTKAYREVLLPLMPGLAHHGCVCHILSLVGDDLGDVCEDMDRLISMWSGLFTKQAARRRRYLEWLRFVHCFRSHHHHPIISPVHHCPSIWSTCAQEKEPSAGAQHLIVLYITSIIFMSTKAS